MRWVCLLLLVVAARSETLDHRIAVVLDSSPGLRRAFWGIEIAATTGEPVYELNARRTFVPASNTKLFTTALALARLGPDYRFLTSVRSAAALDAAGRIAGPLTLLGGGDPMLSARVSPYRKGPVAGDPLAPIEALADQIAARGVRRVEGDIVGDDTACEWEPYPDGWAVDDPVWDYGAPVSALSINDNAVAITLGPARAGRPPRVTLSPRLEFYSIDNRIRTGPGLDNKVHLERLPGSRQLRLWGTMPSGVETRLLLAVDDPALYAAAALTDALTRRGIAVTGRPVALHRFTNEAAPAPAPGYELASRVSPPLIELLQIMDKVSQNLHAELILREVARKAAGVGSRATGIAERDRFLKEIGIEPGEWNLQDGSGLSRLNLVTPAAVVKLLCHMYASPQRDAWLSLLPVGGEDGTLETRFAGSPAARTIRAKTGSMDHVAALSGYVESHGRGTLAFSILVNNYTAPDSEARAAVDRIALLLTE